MKAKKQKCDGRVYVTPCKPGDFLGFFFRSYKKGGRNLRIIDDDCIDLSIDKVSFTGDYDEELRYFLVGSKKSKYANIGRPDVLMMRSNNMQYDKYIKISNGQILIWIDEVKARYKIEFNPNFISEKYKYLAKEILNKVINFEITRLDIAIDFFDDMSNYKIGCLRPVKTNVFYSQNGDIETIYFGSPNSRKRVRYYNKRQQMIDVKKNAPNELPPYWYRLEQQLRYSSDISEIFTDIVIHSRDISKDIKFNDYMILYTYLNDEMFYNRSTDHYRKKVKTLLDMELDTYKYDIKSIIAAYVPFIAEFFNFYKIPHRS